MPDLGVHSVKMHDLGLVNMGVHSVEGHDVDVLDMGVRTVAMRSLSMYCMSIHSIDTPGVGIHKTRLFCSGNKITFVARLKKAPIFSSFTFVVSSFYAD
jgi:hypothetical protein